MRTWLRWYLGVLCCGVALSFGTTAVTGINPMRCLLLLGAVLYFAAAIERPRNAFLMLRNVGWFTSIHSDRSARWTMGVMASVLALVALFVPFGSFK